MAILGNKPPVTQNAAMNATNLGRATNIPGLTAGQYYQPGAVAGYSFGVPRDWSHGGRQYYDPQYAVQLPQQQPSQQPWANKQMRGYNGVKPGGGQSTSTGGGYDQFAPKPMTPKPMGMMPANNSFGGGQLGQISTSIQPQAIYDPWMTDVAVNQAVANADQRSNLQTLMGQFDTPGVSRSSRHAALAAPLAAQQQLTAADAKARIPFEDLMANQRNLFLGQVARENEGLGLGNLSARMYEAQNQDALARMNQSLGYLQTLIG